MDLTNQCGTLATVRARALGRFHRMASRWLAQRLCRIGSRVPIISFTFDDFPRSALATGGAILKEYGAKGTYYASLGLMGKDTPSGKIFSPGDLDELLAQGHELGCHTFGHCHAWDTKSATFVESVMENQRALNELAPGAHFETLSYPISWPRPQTKRRVAPYFVCCRGGGQTFNVGRTDLNHVFAYFLEKSRDNPEAIKSLIERCCHARGWLVLATHDVSEAPTPYGCTPRFFGDIVQFAVNSGAKVLPVADACREVVMHGSKA